MLERSGYPVQIVADAENAQVQLSAEPFTLLMSDWDLGGGMNGDALIAWVKVQLPEMKTILFSNHPKVNEIAVECGADAAFRKDESIAKLRMQVMTLVPLHNDLA